MTFIVEKRMIQMWRKESIFNSVLLKISIIVLILFLIASVCYSQSEELNHREIKKLLPDKIVGYYSDKESSTKKLKVGTLTYTMCEKNFRVGNKTIKLLLFDFINAGIMYKQALQAWENSLHVETDTLISRSVALEHGKGWESYRKSHGKSQILLGVSDRFYLNLMGDNVELETLKAVLSQVPLTKFPK